jgi:hypothetical protein
MLLKTILFISFSFVMMSCCTDHEKIASEDIKKESSKASEIYCAKPPEPVMCCQAMTPTCDACREKSRLAAENWRKNCPVD